MNLTGNRDLLIVAKSIFERRHYRALLNSYKMYNYPADGLRRYLFGTGDYPFTIELNTPLGISRPTLYSSHDMLTVNEIFCRIDYPIDANDRVVVDFGSNIGLSALYFLTQSSRTFCYLFEPVSTNVARLKLNLSGFEQRYRLEPCAVGMMEGMVEFGTEPTGRYGGVGIAGTDTIQVPCRDAASVLASILRVHDRIDVLKIDIEALEREILLGLPRKILERIGRIYVEQRFDRNPLPDLFSYEQYGSVARFMLKVLPSVGDLGATATAGSA